ncbi:hypothetical protein K4754_04315 [Pseudomonas glycinae]|uniref:hypothetical protein n=1 Tax=Pseudomonas glycinae TaxID=1785145 RepID=UPI001C8A499E|nr:hypothetical protein [Pseudomonas glycinae]MBX8621246.1 hypothetical protein [Pseudomonas glycinae]
MFRGTYLNQGIFERQGEIDMQATPPAPTLPPDLENGLVDTKYLDEHNGELIVTFKHDGTAPPPDIIQVYLEANVNVPTTPVYSGQFKDPEEIKVPFSKAVFKEKGNGIRYFNYDWIFPDGSRSPLSHPARVTVLIP